MRVMIAVFGLLADLRLPSLARAGQRASWGHVHPRRNRRDGSRLAGGHAEALTKSGLRDVGHWANPAVRHDWTLRLVVSP